MDALVGQRRQKGSILVAKNGKNLVHFGGQSRDFWHNLLMFFCLDFACGFGRDFKGFESQMGENLGK